MNTLYNLLAKDAPLTQLSESETRFEKQLIRFGDWIDPLWPEELMRIDRVKLETFVKNFKAGVPGRIPVPLTHTDNPSYNAGELTDLYIKGDGTSLEDGLYGVLEIRRPEVADDIRNELIWDVSISFVDNYTDTETAAQYGPTLLHVALVNNPYIKKMGSFTQLAEDLKRLFGKKMEYRMLSENANKEHDMTKVKNDREFAVEVVYKDGDEEIKVTVQPGEELEVPEEAVEAVEQAIADAQAPEAEQEEEEETEEQKAEREAAEAQAQADADAEEARKKEEETNLSETDRLRRELDTERAKNRGRDIDSLYQNLLSEGKVAPAAEAEFRALAEAVHGQTRELSDGSKQNMSELLTDFFAKCPKIVNLDDEHGTIENDSRDDPLKNLPEESKQGLAKSGVSQEDYLKYGAKESVSINELKKEG